MLDHRVTLALFMTLALGGCKAKQVLKPDLLPPATVSPKYVALTVDDVVIKAPDGSWEIRRGKEHSPPFESQLGPYLPHPKTRPPNGEKLLAKWSKDNKPPTGAITRWPSREEARRACNQSEFTRLYFEYRPQAPEEPVVSAKQLEGMYTQLLRRGAQRVMVSARGLKKPLYGVLFLPPLLREAEGKLQRIHRIELTNAQLAQAASGKLTLVMQTYESAVKVKGVRFIKAAMKSLIDEEEFYKRVMVTQTAWALFLSKDPI